MTWLSPLRGNCRMCREQAPVRRLTGALTVGAKGHGDRRGSWLVGKAQLRVRVRSLALRKVGKGEYRVDTWGEEHGVWWAVDEAGQSGGGDQGVLQVQQGGVVQGPDAVVVRHVVRAPEQGVVQPPAGGDEQLQR